MLGTGAVVDDSGSLEVVDCNNFVAPSLECLQIQNPADFQFL